MLEKNKLKMSSSLESYVIPNCYSNKIKYEPNLLVITSERSVQIGRAIREKIYSLGLDKKINAAIFVDDGLGMQAITAKSLSNIKGYINYIILTHNDSSITKNNLKENNISSEYVFEVSKSDESNSVEEILKSSDLSGYYVYFTFAEKNSNLEYLKVIKEIKPEMVIIRADSSNLVKIETIIKGFPFRRMDYSFSGGEKLIFLVPILEEQNNYDTRLKDFIIKLIMSIKINKDDINDIIESYYNDIKMAFVHYTVDINPSSNYERLEYLGDPILKSVFGKYLLERFPLYEPSTLTKINSYYMSKDYQPELAEKLGLNEFIKVNEIPVTRSISEDVFEAFNGALFYYGEKVRIGLGYYIVSKLLESLFSSIDINLNKIDKPKSVIEEYSRALGIVPPRVLEYCTDDYTISIQLEWRDDVVEFFNKNGIKIGKILAVAEDNSKTVARDKAYEKALENIIKYGINRDWINKHKKEKRDKELSILIDKFENIYQKMGYVSYMFKETNRGDRTQKTMMLIAKKKDGKMDILSISSSSTDNDAKKSALKKFLS